MSGATSPMPDNKDGRLFKFVLFYPLPIIEVFIDLKWCRDQYHNKGEDQFWIFIPFDVPYGKNPEKIGNGASYNG